MDRSNIEKNPYPDALLLGEVGLQRSATGSGSSQESVSVAINNTQTTRNLEYVGELDLG